MTSEKITLKIFILVLLLAIAIGAGCYCFLQRWYFSLFFIVPAIIYLFYRIYSFLHRINKELNLFAEASRYRDFSQHFDIGRAPVEVQQLRKNFNEISHVFRTINKEKEIQHQYLQKIMELIDTGIILFDAQAGDVSWMNESLKQLIKLPYLKTIHSLAKHNDALYREVISLQANEEKIYTLTTGDASIRILLSSTTFKTDGKLYKLVAFRNVNEALDETESKAWQKLLSVMTHEIMNSVAPIASLAGTLEERLTQLTEESSTTADLRLGIETIKRRSEGLLRFAETYRNLNKIRELNRSRILVRDLFENLFQLMQPTLDQKEVELEIILKDTSLLLEADIYLVEQVLINLIVNAMEALKNKKGARIMLSAESVAGKITLKVSDNGTGMSPELVEKVFIPFFSTKKNGSGIGLSLCKQIMLMHKGNIHVQSIEGQGSLFLLSF
jgi:signal transduction histidine kinase